jgi:hypothetical protein
MTTDTAAIDAERKARAVAWLNLWRAEREKAQKKRRPMKYIKYDYREEL